MQKLPLTETLTQVFILHTVLNLRSGNEKVILTSNPPKARERTHPTSPKGGHPQLPSPSLLHRLLGVCSHPHSGYPTPEPACHRAWWEVFPPHCSQCQIEISDIAKLLIIRPQPLPQAHTWALVIWSLPLVCFDISSPFMLSGFCRSGLGEHKSMSLPALSWQKGDCFFMTNSQISHCLWKPRCENSVFLHSSALRSAKQRAAPHSPTAMHFHKKQELRPYQALEFFKS